MGFYPVTRATDQYVIGAPLFKKVILELENGNSVIINAPKNGAGKKYIQEIRFNGRNYTKTWLSHRELMKGAVIGIDMAKAPNKNFGINIEDLPFSLSHPDQ